MIIPIQQFVPSTVCLSCDGCCRFKESDSPWRPKMGKEDVANTVHKGLAESIFAQVLDSDGHIKTKSCDDGHICSFFNKEHNTCRIYTGRPFECQLYPFILEQKQGRVALSVHLNCPFVQEKRNTPEFDEYVAYLKKYFTQNSVREFLQKNDSSGSDYSAFAKELEELFVVHLS